MKITRSKEFRQNIEQIVREKEISYWDAINVYCFEHNIEPETIRRLITDDLKKILEQELNELNLLK